MKNTQAMLSLRRPGTMRRSSPPSSKKVSTLVVLGGVVKAPNSRHPASEVPKAFKAYKQAAQTVGKRSVKKRASFRVVYRLHEMGGRVDTWA